MTQGERNVLALRTELLTSRLVSPFVIW